MQVGLGALGRRLTPYLLGRSRLRAVGAVDTDPSIIGRDLGEVAEIGRALGIVVSGGIRAALERAHAAVAVHTTVSSLAVAKEQIEALLHHGLSIVSSCEELSFPWQSAPEIAADIDRHAKAAGRAVLATGVNPGFLMDYLPLVLTGICREVRKITVLRYQDARVRRLPFQQKIGAGLTLEQFAGKKADGSLRHVGLTESMQMIASRLGWKLDRTEDRIEPVIGAVEAQHGAPVQTPLVAGICQLGLGYVDGEERIRLEFRAAIGEKDVQDTVIIDGEPPLRFTATGGVNGDIATCAILTNAIRTVAEAPPGLWTMADLPPTTWFAG
jgi:4-hydroxy-tetrahydrodipicolinate reductase